MDVIKNHIEALIFCSQHPITIDEIRSSLNEMFEAEIAKEDIAKSIECINEKYKSDDFSFQLNHTGGGYQFLTKPAYQVGIKILLKQLSKKRLSTAALETLSIIAYKEPVSKTEIEVVRGVNCDYTVQKLLDKGFVEIFGKSDGVGRPLLYKVSKRFLEYFGINHSDELPTPKDLARDTNTIGEIAEN